MNKPLFSFSNQSTSSPIASEGTPLDGIVLQETSSSPPLWQTEIGQPPPLLAQGAGSLAGPVTLFGVVLVTGLVIWLLNTTIRICDPYRILVISGRQQTVNGRRVGYRVEFGGQTYCIPILETVQSMDMRTMPVPIEVTNAYAKGGTPLNIQAIANVKISSHPVIVRNAIERFLGRNPEEIKRVARETLEGNLRGVVATLTPEQLNEDRLEFANRIAEDVKDDLEKLGLQLDTLKIQSVADQVDYLNSLGRRQIAVVLREAEIAESNAKAESESVEAECKRASEVAKTEARTVIQAQENELRRIKAQLEQRAKSEEERTTAAASEAQAKAQERLQTVRANLEKLRLQADEVLPAEAQRQAKEFLARGEAYTLIENAKAAASVNELFAALWTELGDQASELFTLQQLEMLLEQAAKVPGQLHLSHINAIDSGDGKTLAGLVNIYPQIVREFLKQVEETLGLNLMLSPTQGQMNDEES
ncbi:MAG: flotillin family protein [Prochlorotrichaceae cyanobacterium]|jgi:flotillin